MKSFIDLRSAAMAALIVLIPVQFASEAQIRYRRGGVRAARWYGAGIGLRAYGYGGYGYRYGNPWGFGGQTVEGDYLRGMSHVIRARGQAQESRSRAAINYRQAQGQYVANQKAWNAVYQERVVLARERRAREKARVDARRQNIRARKADLATGDVTPKGPPKESLTASQLDPYTGKVKWPKALLFVDGLEVRLEIEQLFAARVHSGATSDLKRNLRAKIREFEKLLKKRIRSMPSHEYMAAKSFLEMMVRETV